MSHEDWHGILSGAVVTAADGKMATKWVVIAETITEDGEQQLETFASEGSSLWDRMGMLTFTLHQEQLRIEPAE